MSEDLRFKEEQASHNRPEPSRTEAHQERKHRRPWRLYLRVTAPGVDLEAVQKFRRRRLSFAFLSVLCWLVATQHCVTAELWSKPTQKTEFADPESEHSHCSHNPQNNKASPPSPNEGCDKQECCQPLIRASQESSLEKVALLDPLVELESRSSFSNEVIITSAAVRRLPLKTAPPFLREKTFLRYSLLAPNAPPLFS